MYLHVQDLTQIARFYEDDVLEGEDPYQGKKEYIASAIIVYDTDQDVTIAGLCGKINRTFYRMVWQYFIDKGIKRIKVERKGKLVIRDIPDKVR